MLHRAAPVVCAVQAAQLPLHLQLHVSPGQQRSAHLLQRGARAARVLHVAAQLRQHVNEHALRETRWITTRVRLIIAATHSKDRRLGTMTAWQATSED